MPSPMLRRVERELEPKLKRRHGLAFAVVFIVAYVVANIAINAFDMLPRGWQLLIIALTLASAAAWAIRRAAKANGLSVGEYLRQICYSGRRGWQ